MILQLQKTNTALLSATGFQINLRSKPINACHFIVDLLAVDNFSFSNKFCLNRPYSLRESSRIKCYPSILNSADEIIKAVLVLLESAFAMEFWEWGVSVDTPSSHHQMYALASRINSFGQQTPFHTIKTEFVNSFIKSGFSPLSDVLSRKSFLVYSWYVTVKHSWKSPYPTSTLFKFHTSSRTITETKKSIPFQEKSA